LEDCADLNGILLAPDASKTTRPAYRLMKMKISNHFLVVAAVLSLTGCGRNITSKHVAGGVASTPSPTASAVTFDPLTLALVPQDGNDHTDQEIRRYQEKVRKGQNREASLERLGWLFVTKARTSFDPGFYKQAAVCGDVLESDSPGCPESLLLRGYVFENLHWFKEAEPLARELVSKRGQSFDFGLLGDSLMEQGRLDEAVGAYQHMVDLRPDLQSYARVSYIRWLKGQTEGAIQMMQAAVDASSQNDPDSAAWTRTRLALLQFQSGRSNEARQSLDAALLIRPNYPPALLLRGRMLLAGEKAGEAVAPLEAATKANPLPEYQWALAEGLRATGREPEASNVEARLKVSGVVNDPRTFALYLATRGEDNTNAVRLAEAEMQQREDVFTQDALAWALAAAGHADEARPHMKLALAEGTEDGRLFFHAAVIAHRAGQDDESQKWFNRATSFVQMLLPSERKQFLELAKVFPQVTKQLGQSTLTNNLTAANLETVK
jgi:tetratricopeptide (TPR) repeat protein